MSERSDEKAQHAHMLETLRYGPDQIIVNPFDEQVWLAGYAIEGYVQQGLVDCCLTEAPCNYHAAIYEGDCPAPWVPALEWVQHWSGVHAAFMLRSTKAYHDRRGDLWERGDGDRWHYRGDALSSRTLDTLLRLNGPLTPVVIPPGERR